MELLNQQMLVFHSSNDELSQDVTQQKTIMLQWQAIPTIIQHLLPAIYCSHLLISQCS